VRGSLSDALKHYNHAIEVAEQQDLMHLVGLANERAALCCIANAQTRLATWYINCAKEAFNKWGATAKVAWIEREYALPRAPETRASETATTDVAAEIASLRTDSFDIAAALQASRIIASGSNTDLLLTHLMQIIRLQAGAETAHLLALEGGKLRHEASASTQSGNVTLFPSRSTEGQGLFSPMIVNYVIHTGDDLMIHEADTDSRFGHCHYIAEQHLKSVICSGIRHGGELLGVMYLEHKNLVGAFNEQKLKWLQILSGELGLTLWGTRLGRYRDYVNKFAPTEVFKQIEANPQNPDLQTKDCDVSIMFADLAGYSHLGELLDGHQLAELVNRAFSRFVDEIHRFGGILLETRGDELLVLFGDEDPSKHVWKAAKAALAIRRAATILNKETAGAHPPLVMNIGINSGVASVGLHAIEASSGSRWHYGASGTVVNIAARLRELAREGSILMSDKSIDKISNDFVVEDMGSHSLKNIRSTVHVYRLVDDRFV
jgi:class 3 adenylate cyclase